MKNILLHSLYLPLGNGLKYLHKDRESNQDSRWLYIVPSTTLIKQLKDTLMIDHQDLLGKIELMTFDQLMRKLMINENRRMITPEEQELIVKTAIERVDAKTNLLYFHNGVGKSGFIKQVEVWLGEVKRAGITTKQLSSLWSEKDQKYKELSQIYSEYQNILECFALIDHEEPYFAFLNAGIDLDLSDYIGIVTEQFHDFSPIQMQILSLLGDKGLEIDVHLAVDEQRKDLFTWTYNTISFLKLFGFIEKQINEVGSLSNNAPFYHLQKKLFSEFPNIIAAEDRIEIFSVAGIKQEVELVAAEIKALVLNQKIKLNKIAIITTEIDKYQPYIHQIMDKAGIPNTLPNKELLINNAYTQSLISLLKVLDGNKNEWFNLLFSPYFSFMEQIDSSKLLKIIKELSYPETWEIWSERLHKYSIMKEISAEEILPYDNVMKQLYNLAVHKPVKGKNSDFVQFIEYLEVELKVKENILKYFTANPANSFAYRDLKAFEKWEELKVNLRSIDVLLAKNQKILFWDWFSNMIIACKRTKYDYLQNKKSGVNVLSPNQIRGQKFEIVFILGLNEGKFPRGVKNDWLMPDNERFHLRMNDIYLNSSIDYENQQKYQFFQSVISAKEKLYLVYVAKTEDGKEQLRSYYIDEVVDLFVNDTIRCNSLEITDITPKSFEQCVYDNQLINKTFKSITTTSFDDIQFVGIYKLIKSKYPNKLEVINRGIISEQDRLYNLLSNYDGVLAKKIELVPFAKQKVWSTTQLNTAMQCKFAYFANDLLKLAKWEELDEAINPIAKGELFHRILQKFFNRLRNEPNLINSPDKEEYFRIFNNIAEEEWQRLKNQDNLYFDQVIGEIDWSRIKQSIKQIISHELYWRLKVGSNFTPKHLELSFGMPIDNSALLKEEIDAQSITDFIRVKLKTSSVLLRGKIDRIDFNKEDQYVIYDYKSGYAPEKKEIMEGLNLQLPIYILVLEELLKLSPEQIIGAAFYTKGKKNDKGEYTDNRNRGVWKSDFLEQVGISSRVGSKTTNEEWDNWLELIKDELEQLILQLEEGNFEVYPKTDCPAYCAFKSICRNNEEKNRIKKRLKEVK